MNYSKARATARYKMNEPHHYVSASGHSYTRGQMQFILCSISYELLDESLVSDSSWDMDATSYEYDLKDKIDGYDPCTAVWSVELVKRDPHLLLMAEAAVSLCKKEKTILHPSYVDQIIEDLPRKGKQG